MLPLKSLRPEPRPLPLALRWFPPGLCQSSRPTTQNNYFTVISLDYAISATDQVRVATSRNRTSQIDTGAELPVFYTAIAMNSSLASLAEYHSFGASLTNEFRFGYSRYNNTSPVGIQAFPGLDAFPNLVFNDLNLQLGPDSMFPQAFINNRLLGYGKRLPGFAAIMLSSSERNFGNTSRQNSLHSICAGITNTRRRPVFCSTRPPTIRRSAASDSPSTMATRSRATFTLQDTWRLLSRLTLNLGSATNTPLFQRACGSST